MGDLERRSAAEVFEDHLRLAQERDYETDLARNYSSSCIALTGRGIFRGIDGLRELAQQLEEEIPSGRWQYLVRLTEGNAAYLEWAVHSEDAVVDDGADSFFIDQGRIVVQTIHYTVRSPDGSLLIGPDGKRPER